MDQRSCVIRNNSDNVRNETQPLIGIEKRNIVLRFYGTSNNISWLVYCYICAVCDFLLDGIHKENIINKKTDTV